MKNARILVATNNTSDAELVRNMLQDEFENVFVSTDPDKAVADFDRNQPVVLILAFNSLEKAEQYYLGLYRLSTAIHSVTHRTIILCGREEVQRVYALCRKEYFDDYVLFWPMTNDVHRLPMAITHALRDLDRSQHDAQAAEMASQVRRIGEMEILVVDDDEFERSLIAEMLKTAPYHLLFAASGAEALGLLRHNRPDLILMDMVMPEFSGLETLRRIKASARFAEIPVLMITGQSEKDVVLECLKAGAADFLVKPLDGEVLRNKVSLCLAG